MFGLRHGLRDLELGSGFGVYVDADGRNEENRASSEPSAIGCVDDSLVVMAKSILTLGAEDAKTAGMVLKSFATKLVLTMMVLLEMSMESS